MNIIEAFEANKIKRVIGPDGFTWGIGVLCGIERAKFDRKEVFGEWTVVEDPLEVYVVFASGGVMIEVYKSREYAESFAKCKPGRTVRKFREVTND